MAKKKQAKTVPLSEQLRQAILNSGPDSLCDQSRNWRHRAGSVEVRERTSERSELGRGGQGGCLSGAHYHCVEKVKKMKRDLGRVTMASIFKRGGKTAKGPWYASWQGHDGKRRTRCTRTTDKATAHRLANKYEGDAALRRDGVIDARLDNINVQSKRTIESHLVDFESKLRASNLTEQYIRERLKYICDLADYCGWEVAADINADEVNRYVLGLQENDLSARSIQARLSAGKGFSSWLAKHQKLPHDPLASVKKPSPHTDRRHERRILLPEEWPWLESATVASPARYGMTGAERVILYRTAIETGLRAKELRSLTRADLHLDATRPYLVCKPPATKNRKLAKQYIQPELATALRPLVATKTPRAAVFNPPHPSNLARMIRDDVYAARLSWLEEAKDNPEERLRREQSDFLLSENEQGCSSGFPLPEAHMRCLAGDDRCPPKGGAGGDETFNYHADDGYLWPLIPRAGGRCSFPAIRVCQESRARDPGSHGHRR